ncbi:MAG: hypothetical protein SOX56_02980 [[Pasteurella] mairii]|uniref:Lipoprotein n=1 Tax=[Pasteurella] mairii TaxID=757 RepID=A0A379B3H2_9PAST|nr:hypothetical protein [[Pasteurella] mairii]SUB32798.1 Uncharacterised protein [[Pasteurella] mairii]
MKKTLVFALVMSLLTACQTPAISVINSACDGFALIKASRQDSTETLRQILVHNQTYRAICMEDMEEKHGITD